MRDLSLHILDLVQNSIEGGANRVEIDIEEDDSRDILCIRVTDNGRGMDHKVLKDVTNPFHTSRTTRSIGLGLALIDMSTKQCGGHLTIQSAINKGTSVEALYKYSHIDRPPLGNIVKTIKVILIGNPEVNVTYSHKVNGKIFSLSTIEITEALQGISLTNPEVISWLTDYLQQNVKILYSDNKRGEKE